MMKLSTPPPPKKQRTLLRSSVRIQNYSLAFVITVFTFGRDYILYLMLATNGRSFSFKSFTCRSIGCNSDEFSRLNFFLHILTLEFFNFGRCGGRFAGWHVQME